MRLFLFSLFMISLSASAQVQMSFCVKVDSAGNCIQPSTEFDLGKDGGTISLRVENKTPFQTDHLRYKIFYYDNSGNEKFSNTMEQTIRADWTYAWQDIVFYDAGTYKVKVFAVDSTNEDFIGSEIVKIFKP